MTAPPPFRLRTALCAAFPILAPHHASRTPRALGPCGLPAATLDDLVDSFVARCRIADVPASRAGPPISAAATRAALKQQMQGWLRRPELRHVACGTLVAVHCHEVAIDIRAASTLTVREAQAYGTFQAGARHALPKVTCGSIAVEMPSGMGIDPLKAGTLVHEALHALFYLVGDGDLAPASSATQRQALSQASLADTQTRHRRWSASPVSFDAWFERKDEVRCFDIGHYFEPAFDPGNPEHHKTLRSESIVRPMDALAQGLDPATVRALSPEVSDYYDRFARPSIEAYIQSHAATIQHEIIIPPTKPPSPVGARGFWNRCVPGAWADPAHSKLSRRGSALSPT